MLNCRHPGHCAWLGRLRRGVLTPDPDAEFRKFQARIPRVLSLEEPASPVETGQMSAVETGQMSAAETGQMSAVPESSGLPSACGAYEEAPAGV